MRTAKKRGPGPSHLLLTPDHAGNVVGIDPHKQTLTATVVDPRGGVLASEHFRVSGEGHRELEAWARQFGQIARWGIEGSASWGRHTAVRLRCARQRCSRAVAGFRIAGLEQRFPDSDEIAGRRPEREPRYRRSRHAGLLLRRPIRESRNSGSMCSYYRSPRRGGTAAVALRSQL
jgi:hypothetical protein